MAESIIPQKAFVVYWLYDDKCVCPWRHGYVGISKNWNARLQNWQREQRNGRFPQFKWRILFRGATIHECRIVENKLRPDRFIAWNKARGGGGGGCTKEAALLRWTEEGAKEKHSIVVKRAFKKIDRRGANNGHFGKSLSETSKQNISVGRKGKAIGNQNWRRRRPYSEEALRKMGEASRLSWQRGDRRVPSGEDHPMFGRHHSEESKQKNRNAQLLHDWSGERNGFYGKKHSEETRKILSIKAKQRHQRKEK